MSVHLSQLGLLRIGPGCGGDTVEHVVMALLLAAHGMMGVACPEFVLFLLLLSLHVCFVWRCTKCDCMEGADLRDLFVVGGSGD